MTDPSKRPLAFPKWYIPYLEKHRITELLNELARELVIQRPEDHILFMKQLLQQAAASRNVARVILIGSMKINRIAIAQNIAKATQQFVITSKDIYNFLSLDWRSVQDSETVVKALAYFLRSPHISRSGWVIADCINTVQEAKALLKLGVLPTHVLYLVTPFQPKLNELLYCDVPENWPQLRSNLFGLNEIFAKKIQEISLDNKNIAEVAENCIELIQKGCAVKTVKPRIVLLGPRGSGRKTQAKLLSNIIGIIHIDFEYILCQAWTSENDLGQKLRQCHNQVCFHSELLCQIVNKRILEKDCLEMGWILTGYPYTVTDFQFLDSLQTPPNRVIALDCDLNVAKARISRNLENSQSEQSELLKPHPKDVPELIQAEQEYFCKNYGNIKTYCGDTLVIVNGNQPERWVHECILGYVVGGNPRGLPRKGFGTDIPEVCSCECIRIPPRVAKTYTMTVSNLI
ncbi:hypothetical protein ABEB36_001852 [Hypothenemus hampei]|uniref:Adenylate kinase 8 n=1 Tax=Hypothenemus hampei TaxID=57062 RepID=A0ABD1FG04_HYPHA